MFLWQRHWWDVSGGSVLFHATTQCFNFCAFVSLLKAACTTSLLVLKLQCRCFNVLRMSKVKASTSELTVSKLVSVWKCI